MKKNLSTNQNYVLLENSKIVKHKNLKTQNIKHISGIKDTSQIGSSETSSLNSTRGASESKSFDFERYYRTAAQEIRNKEIFYISASVKGHKSDGSRREVNVDIVPQSGDKQIFLKSFTVNKKLKWELFRDLPDAEKTHDAWCMVNHKFETNPDNTKAGKIITRRKYRTVPKFRIGNCALITEDKGNNVIVTVILDQFVYEIVCVPIDDEFFMYRGDWKNTNDMEVL